MRFVAVTAFGMNTAACCLGTPCSFVNLLFANVHDVTQNESKVATNDSPPVT